jgi:hypothetical protein
MAVDFERMCADGWDPVECAALAESRGTARLEVFKAIYTSWGPDAFVASDLERYGTDYPSRAARAAATVGLAVLVLNYAQASCEDVAWFERITHISRKVEALAKADRANDALSFYDRLDPSSLQLTPITEAEASGVVRATRAQYSHLSSVVVDSIDPYPWGWIFLPDLDPDPDRRQRPQPGVDARPLIFDRFTGALIEVHSDETTQEYVRRYEETGWPMPISSTGGSS